MTLDCTQTHCIFSELIDLSAIFLYNIILTNNSNRSAGFLFIKDRCNLTGVTASVFQGHAGNFERTIFKNGVSVNVKDVQSISELKTIIILYHEHCLKLIAFYFKKEILACIKSQKQC